MAIIYSYPKNTNLLASDLLVGTSTAIVAGKKKNQTKSFSLGDLSNYVISNIPIGEIATLNQVLTAGNTSILNAKIGELYLWDGANEDYGKVNFIDGEFHVYDYTGDSIFWASRAGTMTLFNLVGKVATLDSSTITENRMYSLPNKSGLVALVQDIPTKTSDLINDGEDGINPFITAADIPTIPTSFGLYAQTALGPTIVYASGQASMIGTGVGSLTVPANAFKVGDSFVAKMCGNLTNANNEILHFRVRSNGVVIIDALQYTLATATNKYFDLILDFTVSKIGVAGVAELMANGVFTYNKNASNAIEGINFGKISNTVFDTTVTNTLTITAEWVTSNVANTIRSQNFTLTKVY